MPPTLDELLRRARALPREGHRAILGIAGSPGAGKSTLAEHLVRALNGTGEPWVAHVPMDGFHLADAELERLGRRDRKGAPDTFDAAGYAALLRRLREEYGGRSGDTAGPAGDGRGGTAGGGGRAGGGGQGGTAGGGGKGVTAGGGGKGVTVYAPGFERVLEQPLAGAIPVPPSVRLVVTEGNYLLLDTGAWARVRAELDEVWFCELDEAERVRRLVARHEQFGKTHEEAVAWVRRSDQRNADLVAATRDRADLVVPAHVVPAHVVPAHVVPSGPGADDGAGPGCDPGAAGGGEVGGGPG
ncbi:nucleoside triphosphate hydrolase [Streptomyces sp. NPDC003374]